MKNSSLTAILLSVVMFICVFLPWFSLNSAYKASFAGQETSGASEYIRTGISIPWVGFYCLMIAIAALILSSVKAGKAWIAGLIAVCYSAFWAMSWDGNNNNFTAGGFKASSGTSAEYGLMIYLGAGILLILVSIAKQNNYINYTDTEEQIDSRESIYSCSKCLTKVIKYDKYCANCGEAIDWDD